MHSEDDSQEGPQLHLRLGSDLKKALRIVAKKNHRTMSGEATIAIENHIKKENKN